MKIETYKPLPKTVAVRVSPIHGYGLFAIDNIPYGTDLGVSHIFAVGFKDNYVRTPLGGFINHSDTPNCYKVQSHKESVLTYYNLHTTKDIEKGEELTVTYTIYNLEDARKRKKNSHFRRKYEYFRRLFRR